MDIKRFFAVLGIAETKDEAQIRSAYRDKLAGVNPEDDQEGFKRLREAYEGALAYARTREAENQQEIKGNDPVSLYLEKLDEIYNSISRRLNAEEWEKLVREEVLDDLDLGEDAKWRTFFYLAEHYRIPMKIWRVLDRAFGILVNEQEFKEHLNGNFVDFMCRKVSDKAEGSEFPYHRFSGEDKADYDAFLESFDELIGLMGKQDEVEDKEKWSEEVSQKIAFLDSVGISHPWFTLEKARYELYSGKKEEAEDHVRKLRESDPGDHRIILLGMNVLRDCGQEEEVMAVYEDFLQWDGLTNDEVYIASMVLAELYVKREDLLKARENALRAWRIYDTGKASELMEQINTELIAQYTKDGAENLTTEEGTRLAWCFLQTKRAKEGWDFFREHPLLEEDTTECHWVKTALALECRQADVAVREAGEWRRCLLADDDESEEADQREDRIAQSYILEGKGSLMLYLKEENKDCESALGYKKAALAAFDEAIALLPEDINCLMEKMLFEREIHDYEQMAKLCERMKELDSGFYWAYFYGQEAYEGLRKAQEVVDAFYNAKRIYAGHSEIYERAVRVFWDYRQFNDAQNIIRQADEAGVNSPYLTLKKLELLRRDAADEEALRKVDIQVEKVIAEFEEQKVSDELLAEAYVERYFIHTDRRVKSFAMPDKIAEWLTRALELDDRVETRYFLGRYYVYYKEDAKTAYEHLKICEERGMTFEWMYYFIAQCMEDFEDWDGAIKYYKKAAEKAPEEDDFPWRVAWLYRRKFVRTGQKVYCDEALKWLDLQKEKFGETPRDLWQYADIHARMREYETALEEIERALEKDKRSRNLGHKAKMLIMLGRAEEAVSVFEEAIETDFKNSKDYEYSYTQMSQFFWDSKDYEGGIDWFIRMTRKKVITDKQRHDNQDTIRDFYIKLKQWDKALEIVRDRYDGMELLAKDSYDQIDLTEYLCTDWEQEGERIVDLLVVYKRALQGDALREKCRQAEALLEGDGAKALKESFDGKQGAYKELGEVYADWLLDDEKALFCFQKALELIRMEGDEADDSDYQAVLEDAMKCCYRLGKTEKAKEYGKLCLESLSKDYDECKELEKDWKELHANACGCNKRNLYELFCISYFSGEYEQAGQYLKQMEGCSWCWWCSMKDCTELWECKGYIALLDGDNKEALNCFECAVECGRNGNSDASREIMRLKL